MHAAAKYLVEALLVAIVMSTIVVGTPARADAPVHAAVRIAAEAANQPTVEVRVRHLLAEAPTFRLTTPAPSPIAVPVGAKADTRVTTNDVPSGPARPRPSVPFGGGLSRTLNGSPTASSLTLNDVIVGGRRIQIEARQGWLNPRRTDSNASVCLTTSRVRNQGPGRRVTIRSRGCSPAGWYELRTLDGEGHVRAKLRTGVVAVTKVRTGGQWRTVRVDRTQTTTWINLRWDAGGPLLPGVGCYYGPPFCRPRTPSREATVSGVIAFNGGAGRLDVRDLEGWMALG